MLDEILEDALDDMLDEVLPASSGRPHPPDFGTVGNVNAPTVAGGSNSCCAQLQI